MKKRVLSALMVLCMVLTLLPVSAFAVEQKDDYLGGVSLSVGTPKNHLHADPLDVGTFTATVGNTDSYQRLPRLTSYCPRCYDIVLEAIPEYYMVPQVGSYSLSKEGVIDNCSFSLAYSKSMSGYPCLQFNYDAVGAGITEVDLTVYYNFNDPGIAGNDFKACGTCGQWITVQSNRNWYEQTIHFTVTVKDDAKYTVTYTDGVDGEAVFADQKYEGLFAGTDTPAFNMTGITADKNGNPARQDYVFVSWNPTVA
ncbi:MAG: hypothetical protein KHX40_14810, partial [Oscillospiraceae bacterium]|nr:hypothetical protein [Oscillospiraceae bacterium]